MSKERHTEATVCHQALVDELKNKGCIRTPSVEAAFRAVPRHLFLPHVPLSEVYADRVIPTKTIAGQSVSSSSQPAMMAFMLEQLGVRSGHRVLEIGAGTGYNAALIAHIVGMEGHVVTVDIDDDLVATAKQHLASTGVENVLAVCADGGYGYPNYAPYDRIILTASASDITSAWWAQLKSGGRLLLPLSIQEGIQVSIAFRSLGDHLEHLSISPCMFMELRGAFADAEGRFQLGPTPGLTLIADGDKVDLETISDLLKSTCMDWPTGVQVQTQTQWDLHSLRTWLAIHEPNLFSLVAEGKAARQRIIPYLMGHSHKFYYTGGVYGSNGLCLLMRPTVYRFRYESFELFIRSFGADGKKLAKRLIEKIQAWDDAGRPMLEDFEIRAYPINSDYQPADNEVVLPKRWTKFVFGWSE